MATRFAVKTGLWSDTTLWDNGALPTSADDIHSNGFTVTIDQDITVGSLRNTVSNVVLPNLATPAMTSNTQPSGTVISSNNSGTAWYAFNQDAGSTTLYWQSSTANSGWLGYQFGSGKIIKRYFWRTMGTVGFLPKDWTFQGSNDGTTWTTLDTVTGYVTNANYTSGLLANTTSYTYYRINITANNNASFNPAIAEFEMTEATTASPVYGTTTGGSFTVPNTLSGSRNIVQSGDGIKSNNTNTVLTTAHTSGNTVNFNITSGGYIINPLYMTTDSSIIAIQINGTGTVNFNSDIWGCNQPSCRNINGSLNINANATVNINGNVYATKGAVSTASTSIRLTNLSSGATLNITGNLIPSNLVNTSYALYSTSLATVNITGNLNSDISGCLFNDSNGNINIIGIIQVNNNSGVPVVNTQSSSGVSPQTGLVTINGYIVNKNNISAVLAPRIRFTANTTPYWVFQDTTNANITLAYGSATGAYPAEADVRFGVAYAASPTRTGTCRVPLPQYVSQGVLVDATVGTAYLSATDVWNVLTSTLTTAGSVGKLVTDNLNATVSSRASQTSVDTANTNINNLPANVWDKATNTLTTAGSIGERLKTASTVQTTGDQLASYQV